MGRRPIEASDGPCPLGPYIQNQLTRHPGVQERVFAEKIGISRSYFSKLKKGDICAPSSSVLEGIASAFSVPIEEVEVYKTIKQIGTTGEVRPLQHLIVELGTIRKDLLTTTAKLEQVRREIAQQMQIQESQNYSPIKADEI